LNTVISASLQLSRDINHSLEGIQMGADDKSLFPSLFHSLVIEHHRSIVVLVENCLYSSASSLVRCLFEAYVKGLWFAKCAKESDFEQLREDSFNKDFYKLVKGIDKVSNNGLSTAKERYWPNLNSLTHGGTAQLCRRLNGDEITSNFDEVFIKSILKFSDSFALLACGELVEISRDANAQKAFCRIIDESEDFDSIRECVNGL